MTTTVMAESKTMAVRTHEEKDAKTEERNAKTAAVCVIAPESMTQCAEVTEKPTETSACSKTPNARPETRADGCAKSAMDRVPVTTMSQWDVFVIAREITTPCAGVTAKRTPTSASSKTRSATPETRGESSEESARGGVPAEINPCFVSATVLEITTLCAEVTAKRTPTSASSKTHNVMPETKAKDFEESAEEGVPVEAEAKEPLLPTGICENCARRVAPVFRTHELSHTVTNSYTLATLFAPRVLFDYR